MRQAARGGDMVAGCWMSWCLPGRKRADTPQPHEARVEGSGCREPSVTCRPGRWSSASPLVLPSRLPLREEHEESFLEGPTLSEELVREVGRAEAGLRIRKSALLLRPRLRQTEAGIPGTSSLWESHYRPWMFNSSDSQDGREHRPGEATRQSQFCQQSLCLLFPGTIR